MKAEKIIRYQARQALNGNWVAAIAALFTVIVFYLLVFFIFSLSVSVFDIFQGDDSVSTGNEVPYIIMLCFTFLLTVAISPVKNGFLRLCYKVQNDGDSEFREVFYFFSRIKLYFRAIQFNIFYALRIILCFLIASAPYALFTVITGCVSAFAGSAVMYGDIFSVAGVFLSVCSIALGSLLSLRFLPAQFIFAAQLDYNAFAANKQIIDKHYKDFLKMTVSFIPWTLLCFFVLPALYVIPYFFTSTATSTKWLFKLYKEGKKV